MKRKLVSLSALLFSGVLLSLSWPPVSFFIGAMIGFVPLLLMEDLIEKSDEKWKRNRIYWSAFLTFAVWNFCTIHWVSNASWVGVIASVIVNSLFFAGVFLLYSRIKKRVSDKAGAMAFVVLWLAWEYLEIIDWDLSWPWLTLGYSLGDQTWMIQWYEFTGALGGSLWLLIINYAVYTLVKSIYGKEEKQVRVKKIRNVVLVFTLPILLSLTLYWSHEEKGELAEFVVVQPNEDPYRGSFVTKEGVNMGALSVFQRIDWQLNLADSLMTDSTDFVLFPESAVPRSIWDFHLDNSDVIAYLNNWIKKYKNASLITGISYKEVYRGNDAELYSDVHFNRRINEHYRRYNTAMSLNGSDSVYLYNKSRLVIGVERIPSYFVFLQRYLGDFDHDKQAHVYNPNNSVQKDREVFFSPDSTVGVAPIICYESIFGEFVGEYVNKGANVLGVITNDGWWGNTEGYKQHFSFSRIRAIETRRSVARSANTGWSGFINQRGDVLSKSDYWVPAVLRESLQLNNEMTIYSKHGDVLGRLSIPFAMLLLINLLTTLLRKEKN